MSEQPIHYENIITTDRSAEVLARRHGFADVAALAASLSQDAQVLDVGAGGSLFGAAVAEQRPDITWINYDYIFQDPAVVADISKDAPPNVTFVGGDATKLAEQFAPGTFDAVFSYWLLPHLSLDSHAPARSVAKGIFTVTAPHGLMSVGPKTQQRLPSNMGQAVRVVKDHRHTPDSYADAIVAQTKLGKYSRQIQKIGNTVATPFFGTTRYVEKGTKSIYHPPTGEYVPVLSKKGAATAGRLAVKIAQHVAEQRKNRTRLR